MPSPEAAGGRCRPRNRPRSRRWRSAAPCRSPPACPSPARARWLARGLVAGARTRLELRPQVSRDLDGKVAHPVCETALSRRTREALLDRPDDPRSAVRDDEQRVAEATAAHVLEEGPNRLGVLLRSRHEVQQDPAGTRAVACPKPLVLERSRPARQVLSDA